MDKKEVFKRMIVENTQRQQAITARQLKLPVDIDRVVTLYGPRRCGKTYLFYQTIQDLADRNIPSQRILYINFEDERILPLDKGDGEILLDAYFELYPENLKDKNYLFFDEIQEFPLWEKFIRRLSERKIFQIFLTGSSSKLFSAEIATSLRGRTFSCLLTPFSFIEFLKFKNIQLPAHAGYSPSRHKLQKLFLEYLEYGGFPEVLDKNEPHKTQILQGYFDLMFYKDIVERYKIRNFALMKNLMRYLLTHFASLFSMTSYFHFLKSSGQKIGKDTLFEYLALLEDVNFVCLVPLFDYSLKKQTINPKKIYSVDTGLVSAASFQFSENRGRYLENVVFLELLRRDKIIYYYKDAKGYEVDFLVLEKQRPQQLIQVSANLEDNRVKDREIRALVNAARQFQIKHCMILTANQKEAIVEGRLKIDVKPVWQWLLE